MVRKIILGILGVLGVIVVIIVIITIWVLTHKFASVFSSINIPDGEFLRYGNYFEGKKYADLYAVTEKEDNGKGGVYYRSYIELINVADNQMPSPDYKNWPSFSLNDPVLGSTVESEGNFKTNVFNNWFGFEDLFYWYFKVDYDKREGEYILKYNKDDGINEVKDELRKIDPKLPTSCHWGTFFIQSRFVNYQDGGVAATINPVYINVPGKYLYYVASRETMNTSAGSFPVIKYESNMLYTMFPTPESLEFLSKFAPKKGEPPRKSPGKFAVYVEDSDRRLTVKMENTQALGGDYILEEVSNVKTHELFRNLTSN